MNDYQKNYYFKMKEMNRIIGIRRKDGNLAGILTFYIGNGNPEKYNRQNMWEVLTDEGVKGDTCYIDHLLKTKETKNNDITFSAWRFIKAYLKVNHPQIKRIHWNRFKDKKHYTFRKELQNGKL